MSVRNVIQCILSVGEEEVGYDDMVDSMMQAWNGGIPVSSAHNAAGDLHHKDAQQGRERKIFSLPERRSREKRRKAKPEVCCCLILFCANPHTRLCLQIANGWSPHT